ncbi:hypothetical protein [Brevibacillus marinus]|uniref:hypothetical protein n=1 Tax=Brevibacillus marinus TaxID=2496837 RepID=UPI0019D29728|nr:hypothetical protein [Brevibacillus marinus]
MTAEEWKQIDAFDGTVAAYLRHLMQNQAKVSRPGTKAEHKPLQQDNTLIEQNGQLIVKSNLYKDKRQSSEKRLGSLNKVTLSERAENLTTANELEYRQVEKLWHDVSPAHTKDHPPEVIDDAKKSLFQTLFPNNATRTMLHNPKLKARPYVCPFTGKKYGSVENLVRAAIPWLIRWHRGVYQRRIDLEQRKMEELRDKQLDELINTRRKKRS